MPADRTDDYAAGDKHVRGSSSVPAKCLAASSSVTVQRKMEAPYRFNRIEKSWRGSSAQNARYHFGQSSTVEYQYAVTEMAASGR